MAAKIKCTFCKRMYEEQLDTCPFCGTSNPLQTIKEDIENTEGSLSLDDIMNEASTIPDVKYEREEDDEEYIPRKIQKNKTKVKTDKDDKDIETETMDLSVDTHKRSPIKWTDEEKKEKPDYSKMYDENGAYNANFDRYYDDVMPMLKNETDRLLKGREKAIFKAIGSVFVVIAIIVYLIFTLKL